MRARRAVWAGLLVGLGMLGTAPPAFAQHETAADLLDGERAYRADCANCHGPDGDLITGVELFTGRFRRPLSDGDLARIIRTGIEGTPMPPSDMTEAQASQIVAYLHARAESRGAGAAQGDAARGRAIVEGAGGCLGCHRVGTAGSGVGPDLSLIGADRGVLELQQALVDPVAAVQPTARFYRVVQSDGTTVTGRLLNHDSFTVQLLDTTERLRSFQKETLREYGFVDSPMPAYGDRLSDQELADVVSYLASLRGE